LFSETGDSHLFATVEIGGCPRFLGFLLWPVVEDQKLAVAERELGVGMSLVVAELLFEDTGCEVLDDSSDLAAQQTLVGQIGGQGNDVEELDVVRHGFSLGGFAFYYST